MPVSAADRLASRRFLMKLTSETVTIELKNDVAITGTLKSVDQFLNFRIENLRVVGNESVERAMLEGGAGGEVDAEKARWPHLVSEIRRNQRTRANWWSDGELSDTSPLSLPPRSSSCPSSRSSLHSSEAQWSDMFTFPQAQWIHSSSRMPHGEVSP
jgi:small nuclear ribonucleoprotein (snRNP)-like protein